MSNPGTPLERLLWFPTINYELCLADLGCLNFCPDGVIEWDVDTGRPVVAHPHSCVPGCDICAQTCKAHAISLPSREEFHATLRRLRTEAQKASQVAGGG